MLIYRRIYDFKIETKIKIKIKKLNSIIRRLSVTVGWIIVSANKFYDVSVHPFNTINVYILKAPQLREEKKNRATK